MLKPDLTIATFLNNDYAEPALTSLLSYQRNSGLNLGFTVYIDETVNAEFISRLQQLLPSPRVKMLNSAAINNKYGLDRCEFSFHSQYHPSWFNILEIFADQSAGGRHLYVDVDTLCVGSLAQLVAIGLPKGHIGACSVMRPMPENAFLLDLKDEYSYFNSGVILYDAENVRDDFDCHSIAHALHNFSDIYFYGDQCLLNHMFRGRVRWLDKKFNTLSWMMAHQGANPANAITLSDSFTPERIRNDARILHFAGRNKPWNGKPDTQAHWGYDMWQDFEKNLQLPV